MKIVTCISSGGWTPMFIEMLRAMALSIAKNSPRSELFCVTDIDDVSRFPSTCHPLHHKLDYETLILNAPHRGVWTPEMAVGAFMRFDIPLIAKREGWKDDFILYADIDCMVLGELEQLNEWLGMQSIPFLAATPEFDKNDWSYFNSGVMLLNLDGMLESYSQLLEYSVEVGFVASQGVVDQGIYNAVYGVMWSRLPWKYNHKAFCAVDGESPVIVHFQGPKPHHLLGEIETPRILRAPKLNTPSSLAFARRWHSEFRN